MNRCIVIGIDGATFDLLDDWIEAGELPNLRELRDNGFSTELESVLPYYSAPAWTSIVTGKQPNRHGVFDFFYQDGGQLNTINSTMRQANAVWNILDQLGGRSIVLNVPGTYPAEEFDGSMVTGMLTPSADDDFTHPKKLREQLNEYSLDSWWQMLPFLVYSQTRPNKALDIANDIADGRLNLARELMSENDWDLTFMVLRVTDTVQHFLWDNEELMLAMYKNIDQQLGEIREEYTDENIIVLSDHGFRSADRTFYINNFLYNEGYLTTKKNPNRNFQYALSNIGEEIVKLSSYVFPVEYLLENSITERFLSDTISKDVDFDATEAFCLSASASGVRVVAEDDRKSEIIPALVEDLRELRDPATGEKVLDSVFTREERYSDGNVEKAPDIFFTLANQYTISDLIVPPELGLRNLVQSTGDLPVTTERLGYQHSGEHARNGILLMDGPNVLEDTVSERSLLDVLPTLLHAMEYPIPDDLDGSIIKEALSIPQEPEYVTLEERTTTDRGGENDERVKERLQDLGYLG